MKYLVRLNSKALNPLTGKVIASRVWEVEQCSNKDSEKVIWHCAAVKIGDQDIRQVIAERTMLTDAQATAPDLGGLKVEMAFEGIVIRGQDNAIVIREGRHDVQS